MNPHTKTSAAKVNEQIGQILNQRFGYENALNYALAKAGFTVGQIKNLLELARDRNFEEFGNKFEEFEP